MSAKTAKSVDSFKCLKTLNVAGKEYVYYSLPEAEKNGLAGISRLPFSMKVLLENLLRNENGRSVSKKDMEAMAQWLDNKGKAEKAIGFSPARVLPQDFTGVPAVVVGVLADPTAPAVARERAFGRVAEALAALGEVSPRRQVAVERPWSRCAASSHPDAA